MNNLTSGADKRIPPLYTYTSDPIRQNLYDIVRTGLVMATGFTRTMSNGKTDLVDLVKFGQFMNASGMSALEQAQKFVNDAVTNANAQGNGRLFLENGAIWADGKGFTSATPVKTAVQEETAIVFAKKELIPETSESNLKVSGLGITQVASSDVVNKPKSSPLKKLLLVSVFIAVVVFLYKRFKK